MVFTHYCQSFEIYRDISFTYTSRSPKWQVSLFQLVQWILYEVFQHFTLLILVHHCSEVHTFPPQNLNSQLLRRIGRQDNNFKLTVIKRRINVHVRCRSAGTWSHGLQSPPGWPAHTGHKLQLMGLNKLSERQVLKWSWGEREREPGAVAPVCMRYTAF